MQRTTTNPLAGSPGSESALRGATLAFRASPSPSNKNAVVTPVTYGAVAAASRAGTGRPSTWKPPVPEKKLIRTDTGNTSLTAGRTAIRRSSSQNLGYTTPIASPINREISPSFLAATRAASRSQASVRPSNSNGTGQKPQASHEALPSAEVGTDETSIPPTNRLVELFEAKRKADLPPSASSRKTIENVEQEKILSPTPLRPSLSIRIRAPTIPAGTASDPVKLKSPPQSPSKDVVHLEEKHFAPFLPRPDAGAIPVSQSVETGVTPAIPARRRNSLPKSMQVQHNVAQSKSVIDSSSLTTNPASKILPQIPPPRRTRPMSVAANSPGTYVLARTISTPPVIPRQLTNKSSSTLKPQLTADSLANAMVASSLASSRASSPTRSVRPPPSSRLSSSKTNGIASLFLLHSPTNSPAPPKLPPPRQAGLRQTLRRSPSTSSDEDVKRNHHHVRHQGKHNHGLLIKKHPNKHAEGARRRWRDSITERERKRYEGVWAANRGILINHEKSLDSSAEPDDVHALIVKDIWSRSGLGARVLEEVWELVECGGRVVRNRDSTLKRRGRLKKHEFVVGLWLVDQSLKGRKLPLEVQDSVWASARGLMAGLRTR